MDFVNSAADQVVNLALKSATGAIKLTTKGTKSVAKIASKAIKEISKSGKGSRGKMKLKDLLERGGQLDIFTIPFSQIKSFIQLSKKYGLEYTVIRDSKADPNNCLLVMNGDNSKVLIHLFNRYGVNLKEYVYEREENGSISYRDDGSDRFNIEFNKKESRKVKEDPILARREKRNLSVPSSNRSVKNKESVIEKLQRYESIIKKNSIKNKKKELER